jgi:predicted phage tail protein
MDMFMDKLAQKFTAQEIIKANNAAETAVLDRLKGRTAEYSECLEKLQKLIEDENTKLTTAQADNQNEVKRLVDESIAKIQAIQKDTELLEHVHKESVKVYRNVQAVVVEEGVKNKEATDAIKAKLDSVSGKVGVVLGVACVALVASVVSMVLQILQVLNINFF